MLVSTSLGYAAIADGNAKLIRPPWTFKNIPVRVAAAAGFIYYSGSFIALQAGGAIAFYLPLAGISVALGVFVHRTMELWGGYIYRRKLRIYSQNGALVFVPQELILQATAISEEQNSKIPPTLFDQNLKKTSTLVELYNKDGYSPKVQSMLRRQISNVRSATHVQ